MIQREPVLAGPLNARLWRKVSILKSRCGSTISLVIEVIPAFREYAPMSRQPKVIAVDMPAESRLWERVGNSDFLDCYAVHADATPRHAANIIMTFPGWARVLLILRKVFTAPFGLDNTGPDVADKVGIFPVESETPTELIAGFNDRHLDFSLLPYIIARSEVWYISFVLSKLSVDKND